MTLNISPACWVRIPRGHGCSIEGALTKGTRYTETVKRSGLQKHFNPEYFTAVIYYLVHTDGGKKSVQKFFYWQQRQFWGMLEQSRTANRIAKQNNVAPNLCVWLRMATSPCPSLVLGRCNATTWTGTAIGGLERAGCGGRTGSRAGKDRLCWAQGSRELLGCRRCAQARKI